MIRQEGYYWVEFEGKWDIAYWTGYEWKFMDCTMFDEEFDNIDGRQIIHVPQIKCPVEDKCEHQGATAICEVCEDKYKKYVEKNN